MGFGRNAEAGESGLGQIRINRIIGVFVYVLLKQGNLRIRVVYFKFSRRRVGPGRDSGLHKPQARMFEDLLDNLLVLDETDDAHLALALRARKRVHFVYFLN